MNPSPPKKYPAWAPQPERGVMTFVSPPSFPLCPIFFFCLFCLRTRRSKRERERTRRRRRPVIYGRTGRGRGRFGSDLGHLIKCKGRKKEKKKKRAGDRILKERPWDLKGSKLLIEIAGIDMYLQRHILKQRCSRALGPSTIEKGKPRYKTDFGIVYRS